jgi:hypothetical protein
MRFQHTKISKVSQFHSETFKTIHFWEHKLLEGSLAFLPSKRKFGRNHGDGDKETTESQNSP